MSRKEELEKLFKKDLEKAAEFMIIAVSKTPNEEGCLTGIRVTNPEIYEKVKELHRELVEHELPSE